MAILINNRVIQPGTELGILRKGNSIDGRPIVAHQIRVYSSEDKDGNQQPITVEANHVVEAYKCVIDEKGNGVVLAHSIVDGKKFKVYAVNIFLIDHMLPEKVAKVYGYNPDGTKRAQGKKRGRKSTKHNRE